MSNPENTVNIISRIFRVLLFGLVTGVAASLFAVGFVELVLWLNKHLLVSLHSRLSVGVDNITTLLMVLIPAAGGLLVGLLIKRINEQRPHTPTDIIQTVQCRENNIPGRTGFLNALAALVGLGSGASVGQYGPLAHLGASLGSQISRLLRVDGSVGIGCGVAAAISTAFNAPIAGIIFAHEVILRHYSLRAFAPITVASSVGFFITNYILDRPPLFVTTVAHSLFAPEFFSFVLIGVSGALVAVVFMRCILFSGQLARRLPIANWPPGHSAVRARRMAW